MLKKFLLSILIMCVMSLAVNQYVPGGAVPQSFRLQNNTQSAILTGGWMPYGSMAWANDDSNMIVRDYAGVFHIFKPYTAFYLKHSLVDSAALAYTAVRADSSGKTGQIYWDSISARTEYLTGSMGIGNVQPIPTRKLSVSTGGVEGVAKFLQSQDAGTVLPAVEVVSAGKSALDVAQWMNSNGYWIQRWYDNASRTFGDTASISGGVQIFAAGIRADGKMFLGDSSRLTANLTVSKGLRIRDSLTADSANIRAIGGVTVHSLPCTTETAYFKHKVGGVLRWSQVGNVVTMSIPCLKDTAIYTTPILGYATTGTFPSPVYDAIFTIAVIESTQVVMGTLIIHSNGTSEILFEKNDCNDFCPICPDGMGMPIDPGPIALVSPACITITYIAQ